MNSNGNDRPKTSYLQFASNFSVITEKPEALKINGVMDLKDEQVF